jgi:restriction endonuclease S subunit
MNNLSRIKLERREIETYVLEKNDCIVNRVSKKKEGIGKVVVARIGDSKYKIVFESNMFRIKLDEKKIDVDYFSYFSQDWKYTRQIQAQSQKANQTSINQAALKSVLLPLPSTGEQHSMVTILSASDEKIAALQGEILLLEELFQTTLEELMTDRLSLAPIVEAAHS